MAVLILKDFNVSVDNKFLNIDVVVDTEKYQDIFINSLEVCCDGKFDSQDQVKKDFDVLIAGTKNKYTDDYIDWDDPSELQQIGLKIQMTGNNSVNICTDNPFYLKVTFENPSHEEIPCADDRPLKACTFNTYPLYQHIACAARAMQGCEPPFEFVDFLLKLQALKANIVVGSADDINYYYKWLISHSNGVGPLPAPNAPSNPNHGCGCHS